jgi:glutamate carboxypeptidase
MEISDSDKPLSEMLVLLQQLVESESPTKNKAAVDQVGTILNEQCRRLGAQVKVHTQAATGNHIEARWGKGSGGILLLAHMDTVFPLGTLTDMPFHIREDRIFGPGVSDMKGGIVVGLTAIATLLQAGQLPSRPVTVLFTSDEETGSDSSRAVIESLAKDACLVLVLEPGMLNGAVKTWRKGVGEFRVKVRGRAAHAGGDHANGRNAIEEMAHQVLAIQMLTDYARGTTLNVGIIQGGIASNVVPAETYIEVDLRVMQPGEAERIMAALFSLKPVLDGTTVEVTGGVNRPPMPFDDGMQLTFKKARTLAAAVEIDLKASGTGGASDANFVARLGIPVLDGLGPAGAEYHSEREFILAASLTERLKLLCSLLRDW